MEDNNLNAADSGDSADLTERLTRLAMMLRRVDMAGHGGRTFGGMRAGQGRVLHILTLQSPMPQKELAYMLGVRPQSLSEVIGKLEASGLVERRRDDTDRRTFIVDITEEGRSAASEIPESDDPFDVLSEDEQAQFADMLDRVSAAVLEKLPERPEHPGHGGHGGRGGRGFGGHGGPGFGGPRGRGGFPGGFGDGRGRHGHGGDDAPHGDVHPTETGDFGEMFHRRFGDFGGFGGFGFGRGARFA